MKINNVYVINLAHRVDRWQTVQDNFKDSGLNLVRWNAINGTDINSKTATELTTSFCDHLCSPGMIGCWLSHKTVWQDIVDKQHENALVLEDDAIPVPNFINKFNRIKAVLPVDYDLVYLGCIGSCSRASFITDLLGMQNQPITNTSGETIKELYKPGFPLAAHAYMISLSGAQKLVTAPELQKIQYHVDFTLAVYYARNPGFNVYAATEQLVNQSDGGSSDIAVTDHPVISKGLRTLHLGFLDTALNTQMINIRKLHFPITGYTLLFAGISFLIGYKFSWTGIFIHLGAICLLDILDVRKNKKSFRAAMQDTIVALIFAILGHFCSRKHNSGDVPYMSIGEQLAVVL